MANKKLKFSIYTLILNSGTEEPFNLKDFSMIESENKDIIGKKDEEYGLKKVEKNIIENRFVSIYIAKGEKTPYSKTVFNLETKEEYENPKKDHEVELNDKFFAIIDVHKQRLFISDLRVKDSFCTWLGDKIGKKVNIKAILEEEKFLEKIKTINEVSFFINPNLFAESGQNTLGKELVQDIWGYEADSAKLTLNYNRTKINANIMFKLKQIFRQKPDFNNISIVGRSDENFESIFNLKEIVSKIGIEVEDVEEEKLNTLEVFNKLVSKIKEYENK